MKKILSRMAVLSAVFVLSGCMSAKAPVSHKEVAASTHYEHDYATVDMPYAKVVSNFRKGLKMCAKNIRTSTYMRPGTGAVTMPGNNIYHTFDRVSSKKSVYAFRMFMGGVMVGDCAICQPEGGIYRISTSIEKVNAKKTNVAIHYGSMHTDEVKAISNWIRGDFSSCHGFMGQD